VSKKEVMYRERIPEQRRWSWYAVNQTASKVPIIYTPHPATTSEGELNALASIYRFLLLEKGGRHDLTKKTTTDAEGVRQDKEGKDSNVCC
jgi:hypothetical protein